MTNRKFYKDFLRELPPKTAAALLADMMLPLPLFNALLALDVQKLTIQEAADRLHTTDRTLKRRRARAYDVIARITAQ